ncbi:MAG: S16 family serine protease [Candidatus Aenigmatarchaeota archaeon]
MKKRSLEILAIILSIALIINIMLIIWFEVSSLTEEKEELAKAKETLYPIYIGNVTNYPIVEIYAPAVDNNGNGVITKFRVQAIPGTGRVLVNINNLVYWVDTQSSIQTARKVAEKFTKINLSNIDVIYDIDASNTSIVGGPSGGAALTLATIAAIKNVSLRKDITITGTINEDGIIGQVGGIKEKTEAAKKFGLKAILVPFGESESVNYIPVKKCEEIGFVKFCIIEYKAERQKIKEKDIDVIEVSNIEEAWKYFSTY